MKNLIAVFIILLFFACNTSEKKEMTTTAPISYETISLLGDTLRSAPPSEKVLQRYTEKKRDYDANPHDLDNLIWYGRFTAYLGNYREAIEIFSEGLKKFPDESRLLRHRGHRYISIREFDKAIADLGYAAILIQEKENHTEQDGMPNDQNIPVSTMHGNIYYHLGLAYYLKKDFPKALDAYKKCLETSSSTDNVVSATHWIYMTHRRMGRKEAAENYLRNISQEMSVIENTAYHEACLFYKGELTIEKVYKPSAEGTPTNSALKYGIGNWYLYNGDPEKAKIIFNEIMAGNDWSSFGFIAAEADLVRLN